VSLEDPSTGLAESRLVGLPLVARAQLEFDLLQKISLQPRAVRPPIRDLGPVPNHFM